MARIPPAALRVAIAVLVVAGAVLIWRTQLIDVSRTRTARPLEVLAAPGRDPISFDVTLPVVPVGMARLESGVRPLLVHYWAPWERDGKAQAVALDSMRRSAGLEGLDVVVVCFDPFPSVARFVARHRLRMRVVLDHGRHLERALDCPELPFTWVLDGAGRPVVAQGGPVDWLSPATLEVLTRIEAARRAAPEPRAPEL